MEKIYLCLAGLSWAFLCGSGIISSFVGSYYVDMTKQLRGIFLWSNFINIVGNLMYLVYYSPYVVLAGQFLIGTAAARMVAGVGEISRIYGSDEITQKVAFMGIFSTLGSILGPCSIYLFDLVDTSMWGWRLNINNMVGVVMGVLYFLQFWTNFFTLKNLSREYNLKKEESDALLLPTVSGVEGETSGMVQHDDSSDKLQLQPEQQTQEVKKNELESLQFQDKYLLALRTLLKNKEVLFLYALSFFCSYARATIILLSPMKASAYLKWFPKDLATFNIVSTFAGG